MSDWEDELENIEENKDQTSAKQEVIKTDLYNDEHENIQIQQRIKEEQKEVLPKEDDYEYKWREKNKALLQRKEEEKLAFENLSETERAKKQQELTVLRDVTDLFMGVSTKEKEEAPVEVEKPVFLKTEEDFINFGIKVAAKLNQKEEYIDKNNTKKGKEQKKLRNVYNGKFIYEFIKTTLDNLIPHLDSNQLTDLNKNLNVLFNKTLQDEKKLDPSKKKSTASKNKPQVNAKKGVSKTNDYGDDEYYDEYEDYDDYN